MALANCTIPVSEEEPEGNDLAVSEAHFTATESAHLEFNELDTLEFEQFQLLDLDANMSLKQENLIGAELCNFALDLNIVGQHGETDALCDELTPEALASSFTEAEVDELISGGGYQTAMVTSKWNALARGVSEVDYLGNEELSYEFKGVTEQPLEFASLASRPNFLGHSVSSYGTPSVLVSPASDCSTAAVEATSQPRRRRHSSSCSSESASDYSASVSARTSAAAHGGAKRRRGSSRHTALEKDSDEYRRRRVRNNVAVRKSRDKAKKKQEETSQKVRDLSNENETLARQLDSVTQELTLLRSIFANLGVPIQQLVTDALQSATRARPHTSRLSNVKK